MIQIFRKEIDKWRSLLWIAVASIPIGAISYAIFRRPLPSEIKVGSVNGMPIYFPEYQHELVKINMHMEMLRNYAQAQGLDPEMVRALTGIENPEESALKSVVNEKLLDRLHRDFQIEFDEEYFLDALGKSIPQPFIDQAGRLNEPQYRDYLRRMQMTPQEYESYKEGEFKRMLVSQVISESAYIPAFEIAEQVLNKYQKKQFEILHVPFAHFVREAQKVAAKDDALKAYHGAHQEEYRIPQKRKARFWTISKSDYLRTMEVEDETIATFYEKHKTTLFRIPPEIKVRKIVMKTPANATEADRAARKAEAEKVFELARKDPQVFADVAKKYSQDETASRGGLVDFFKRGTYDTDFETIAFRLQNHNEVSELVERDGTFTIVQLVERKVAQPKPLATVRDEIVTMIKDRRAQVTMKSDLEKALYDMRSDSASLESFAKEHKLAVRETEWLAKSEGKGYTKEALLAQKLFAIQKATRNYGYFMYHDDYVVYQESAREDSSIPSFESVKDRVAVDYYNRQALQLSKEFGRATKRELLSGATTLAAAAQAVGQKVQATALATVDEKEAILDKVAGLSTQAFELTDPRQVLKFKRDSDLYLVRLKAMGEVDLAAHVADAEKLAGKERKSQKTPYLRGFVASLVRNATIEHNPETLTKVPYHEHEEF